MSSSRKPRYRFAEFVVSPSRRLLLRAGAEVPLIPRYFDLLVLLLERRNEAVHRRDILDHVWHDVVVSDGALSQAVRTLRRALGGDAKAFVRTIPRHGYRFVYAPVTEEADEGPLHETGTAQPDVHSEASTVDALIDALLGDGESPDGSDERRRREAAESLHVSGTAEALARLGRRAGHEQARALLRDARWAVPTAGHVPILGQPGAFRTLRTCSRTPRRSWRCSSCVCSTWASPAQSVGRRTASIRRKQTPSKKANSLERTHENCIENSAGNNGDTVMLI